MAVWHRAAVVELRLITGGVEASLARDRASFTLSLCVRGARSGSHRTAACEKRMQLLSLQLAG